GGRPLALIAVAPVRVRDLAHVDVAAGVHGEAVRRDELVRLESGGAMPEPRQHLTLDAVDAHPRADVRHVVVDAEPAADLPHVETALRSPLEVQPGGSIPALPLPLPPPPPLP